MPAVFVHVSDIHFGQERDHVVHILDDVKRELVADAAAVVASLPSRSAHGILVTGDIASAGKAEEYVQAGKWLDSLAAAIGCPSHRVWMIPDNHDVDRHKLSVGGRQLLDFIRVGGAAEYEQVMSNANDRATLFSRFENYSRFSIGYDCGLDQEAKYATDLRFEVGHVAVIIKEPDAPHPATVPDLGSVFVTGNTPAEVKDALPDALAAHLDARDPARLPAARSQKAVLADIAEPIVENWIVEIDPTPNHDAGAMKKAPGRLYHRSDPRLKVTIR